MYNLILGEFMNCIFCKIINGEIPGTKVYEDDKFVAILDISQLAYGHTLVIPKTHYANIYEMPADLLAEMIVVVQKLAKQITKALDAEGCNILNNNGPLAGQTVNHFHVHIIPRKTNDGLTITYDHDTTKKFDLETLQKQIKAA